MVQFLNSISTMLSVSSFEMQLQTVRWKLPQAYKFVHASYANSSTASSDRKLTLSDAQQTKMPNKEILWGHTFFCSVVVQCSNETLPQQLNLWYIALGSNVFTLLNDLTLVRNEGLKLRLNLNDGKCELKMINTGILNAVREINPAEIHTNLDNAS